MINLIIFWSLFFESLNSWTSLIKDTQPLSTPCGLIYELPSRPERPQESLAIADMRSLPFMQPHYHPETEVYFVLQGTGIIVIGGKQELLQPHSVSIIPSNVAHFVIPLQDLVIAVVNTPPFDRNNYKALTDDDATVCFDSNQFKVLVDQYCSNQHVSANF